MVSCVLSNSVDLLTNVDIRLKDACVCIVQRRYLVELGVERGDARPIIVALQQVESESLVHYSAKIILI